VTKPHPDEFEPLCYFPWDSRPESLLIEIEEAATALYLADGHLDKAAAVLKVDVNRLKRAMRGVPKLQRLLERLRESRTSS